MSFVTKIVIFKSSYPSVQEAVVKTAFRFQLISRLFGTILLGSLILSGFSTSVSAASAQGGTKGTPTPPVAPTPHPLIPPVSKSSNSIYSSVHNPPRYLDARSVAGKSIVYLVNKTSGTEKIISEESQTSLWLPFFRNL